jgi:hypothetical protein
MMSQPLSDPSRAGIRFLPRPFPAAPSARLTAGLPSREVDGLTTSHRRNPRGSGPALTPVALQLRRMSLQHPDPATYRFGPSLSATSSRPCLRRSRRFTWVGRTTRPWPPTAAVLAVATSARAPIATLAGEDMLSRGFRTPPLPATHASVEDCWQDIRYRRLPLEEQHTSRDTLVSHADGQKPTVYSVRLFRRTLRRFCAFGGATGPGVGGRADGGDLVPPAWRRGEHGVRVGQAALFPARVEAHRLALVGREIELLAAIAVRTATADPEPKPIHLARLDGDDPPVKQAITGGPPWAA